MSGWVVFAAWVLGVLLSWRSFAMSLLTSLEGDFSGLDGTDRAMSAGFGLLLALAWPVMLPVRQLWRAVKFRQVLQTPNERQAAEKRELDDLRRLAREHNLPMPGGES